MMNEKDKMEQEISDLTLVNKELAEYVETLEKRDFLNCQGRKMHEVGSKQKGSKQKGRKLRVLKNKAQCALWFMKSFSLEMSQIKLKDEDGSNYSFDYAADHGASSNLCQNDIKERVEQILFLLDKFCVGDAVYHEFTSLSDDLPKSYLVKQMRGNMNKTYHIERTRGYPGARLNFTSTLRDHVQELLTQQPGLIDSVLQVKLSGGGACITRSTNFMMFSFALLQQNNVMLKRIMKHLRLHFLIFLMRFKEDYETLKTALPDFFDEVNSLIEKGTLLVDGKEVKLEFFLGGDYIFLLMVMSLNSANADYACLCLRSLLRVTDRLLQNVIDEILEKDSFDDFNKPKGHPKGANLKKFVEDVNELGVTFSVWYKKNGDGSSSNILHYTSLVGAQKKLLLKKLPSKLPNYLNSNTAATVVKIWEDFKQYYDFISDPNLTSDMSNTAFEKAKQWLELFCSIKKDRTGYENQRVTPYMHIMCYHVPLFMQNHGCFKKFTGQGVEKNNDDAKRILFQKSNKWDSAKDILFMESRQWDLGEHEKERQLH
ncbi:Hypothetical predicted protein [Paramuricea clavata]|uniref:Uncharacterized protein n=1 Tax=Paramuricea clavata TaxID=317549 RepID=A0A7D9ICH4_PARCT|nr:Hypothetical predicted protein [Paramuricea clavata]